MLVLIRKCMTTCLLKTVSFIYLRIIAVLWRRQHIFYSSSGKRVPETGTRILAGPRLMPPSRGAGGGIRRQTCLSVSEFLASRHWRPAQGSPQGRHRRVSFSPYFFWTSKRSMPGGEHRQFDGQLNDDYSIEVLVYRKSLFY
jgi:hypothetical protein